MKITLQKLRFIIATALCCFVYLQANAQLSTGDIAFTAYNVDGDEDFTIVALADIPANTTVYFTENEPQTAGGFNTGEGFLSWNSGGIIISAGTVIAFTDVDNPVNGGFGSSLGTLSDGSNSWALAASGDAIFAYLGTSETTPTTFLAGIASDDALTVAGDYSANGLTLGSTMVVFPTGTPDGGVYVGPRAGESNFSDYLSLIGNNSNWTTNSGDGEALLPHSTTVFTILATFPEIRIDDGVDSVACGATGTDIFDGDSVSTASGNSTIPVTISNIGTDTLIVSGWSIGGTHASDFANDPGNPATPFGILPGKDTIINILFDPSADGARSATLTLLSDDADEATCIVPLNGTGISPELDVLDGASSIACGATGISIFDAGAVNTILGTAPITVTISNTGTDTLVIFGLVLGGANMADFTLDGSVPATPFSVLPGSSQNVVINFDPSADGARSATLTITSDDTDELSCMVPLNGTGFTPADLSVLATCTGISLPTEENMFHIQILNLNPTKTYGFDIDNDGTPDVTGVTGVTLWTTAGQTGWPMAFLNGTGSDTIGVDTSSSSSVQQTFIAHEILCTDIDGDNTIDNNAALCNTSTLPEGEIIAQAAPYNGNNVYKYILTDSAGIVFNPIVANYSGHFINLLNGNYKVYAYNFADTTDANTFCDSLIAGATDLDTVTSPLCIGVCGSASYNVDCLPCPIAIANNTDTIIACGGEEIGLAGALGGAANSGTWVGGLGQFPDGRTDLNGTYIPDESEYGTSFPLLLVTDDPAGICPADTDTVILTILMPPLLGPIDPVLACGGSFDLASLTVVDSNSTSGQLFYYDGLPLTTPLVSSIVTTSGTYYVLKVTNTTPSCFDTVPVTVTVNPIIDPGASVQNPTCPGDQGLIFLSVSGGTGGYSYEWSNGNTTLPFIQVTAGTYTVTVTDAAGCDTTQSFTLVDPAQMTISAVLTDPLCNNGTDGSIDITVNNGTGPYNFNWNDGSYFTEDLVNISAGLYGVVVTDANLCTTSATYVLNNPPTIDISANITANPCPGDSVASIDVSVSGGTQILEKATELFISEYGEGSSNNKWVEIFNGTGAPVDLSDYTIWRVSNGGTWPEATYNLFGTLANNSTFLIVNSSADTALTNYANATTGTLSHSGDDAIGLAKLGVLIDAVGEDGPDPGTAWDVAGVTNGTKEHSLIRKPTVLSPNTNWAASAGTNTTDSEWIVSSGQDDFSDIGQHAFTPPVASPPYLFAWSNSATTEDVSDLNDGIYTITVTDGQGCSESASFDVTGIDSIPPTVICQDVTVYLGLTGSATVSTGDIDNGSFDDCPGALTFELNKTLFTCADLGQNLVVLTVTDSFANIDTCHAIVTVLDTIRRATCSMLSQASSCGTNDGSAVVAGIGTGPFSYLWNNGETNDTVTNLNAGTHTVIVTDAVLCSDTCEVTITGPSLLAINCIVDANATCNGNSDGAAFVSVNGGLPPYIYSWTSGSVTGSATNLAAGVYTVSVTDQSGCTLTCSVTITEPALLFATASKTDVSCFGAADGEAGVSPTGGTPPYTYLWDDPLGQTTGSATGLSGGNYIVIVTDSNMCNTTVGVSIFEPAPLANNPTVVQPLCNGDANGKITAIITGGTAPYLYSWNTGDTTAIIDGLTAGQYILTVTDSNNCVLVDTIVVDEPNLFNVSVNAETILCAGDSNANIIVNVIGGATPPYSYLWNTVPAQTTASASNLAAGTYQLIITDFVGCDTVITTVVNENDPIAVLPFIADVNCNVGNDGAIGIVISGGAPASSGYNILWSNGNSTTSNTGLMAGTYVVTVSDSLGCELVDSFVVAEPSVMVISTSAMGATCFGFSNGSATATVTGGTPGYSYLWSNSETTSTISGLAANTYTVIVTDANACTQSAQIIVGEAPELEASFNVVNVDCNGANTGSASIIVSGGTAPYSYLWSNAATTQTTSGLIAGTYTIAVTDSNNCVKTFSVTVNEPNSLTCNETITNVLCNGDSTGSVFVVVSGGSPSYTYQWSNGDTGPIADSLSAGTYVLTVTDANGCTKISSYLITEPLLLATTTSKSRVSCKGGSDGTATVVAGGGVPPYTYLWNTVPAKTTSFISGLSVGAYHVTVTDANGCVIQDSVDLTQPSALLAFFIPKNPTCGLSNGEVNLLVGGGIAPYTFLWSNGTTLEDATGLDAGVHFVTIIDNNGCASLGIIYLTDLQQVQVSTTVMNVGCNGSSTGMATAFATGGTGTFSYLWSDGQTTPTAVGLGIGTYTVTVFDGDSCSATTTASITTASPLSCSVEQLDTIFCSGDLTAKLQANVIGGTAPYSYLWNTNPVSSTSVVTGVGAGTYSVIVTDANGCTSSCSIEVLEPETLKCFSTSTDALCSDDSSGSASVFVTGGTANILPCHYVSFNVLTDGFPIETTWMVQNGSTLDTLIYQGPYTFAVDDSTVFSDSLCLTEGDTLIFSIFDEFNDGIFEPGGYWIMIDGDTVASNFTFATFTASEVITIPVADTTNVYHYVWSNGDTTQTASNLSAGTYTVIVTDLYGCTTSCAVDVGAPDPIATSISSTNSLCFEDSSGTATVNVSGGTPGVFANFSNNQVAGTSLSGPNFNTLSGGVLTGRPFDFGGCCHYDDTPTDILQFTVSASGTYTIHNDYLPIYNWDGYMLLYTDPLDWTSNPPTTFIAGSDDFTGIENSRVTVNLNAGQNYYLVTTGFTPFDNGQWLSTFSGPGMAGLDLGDYSYQWSNGSTTQTVNNLSSGTYYVTVTDGNGCTSIDSVTINEAISLMLDTITSTNVTCKDASDGTATIGTVSGGTPPYTVSWNTTPPQFTAAALGLSPGIYHATITDANGCIVEDIVEVTEPDQILQLQIVGMQTVACQGGFTGSATVAATGGALPYSYLWSDGQTNAAAIGLSAQVYVVSVTDANGCQTLLPVPLTSPFSLSVAVNTSDALCNNDSSGTASAVINGGTGPYTYIWINSLNDTVGMGSNSTISSLFPGNYTVIVIDVSGCMAMRTFTIYQPSAVVQYTSVSNVVCNGGSDGSATSIVFAGTPPYSYVWSNGQTTQTASNLSAGTYTVLITDGSGCISMGDSAIITEPMPILLNPNVTTILCNGSDVGLIALQVTGGTPPYQYTWSTGETTPLISMLSAGTYTVTASDLFGCTADSAFTLIEADSISCSSIVLPPSCNGGADGSITIDSTWGGVPGTSGYTYSWSNGQTGNTATGLTAGNWFVSITDSIGCSWTKCIKVGEPTALLCATSSTDVLCYGDTNGTVNLTVSGGSPFTTPPPVLVTENYIFSGAPNPSEGEIAVVVGSVIVPAIPVGATLIGADISFYQLEAFSPSWQSEMRAELSGAYILAATQFSSTNGSGVIGDVTLPLVGFPSAGGAIDLLMYESFNDGTPIPDGHADSVVISVNYSIPGTVSAPYTYLWSNSATTEDLTGAGTGTYTVTITDGNGCTTTCEAIISEPDSITFIKNIVNATCGLANGSVSISASGGAKPYSYMWSNGQTTQSAIGLAAGNYTIVVTDANGCIGSGTCVVDDSPVVQCAVSDFVEPSCNGYSDGSATVTVTGGIAPYTYLWNSNPVQSTQTASNLLSGNYMVTVTDSLGCTATCSINLGQPDPLTYNVQLGSNVCSGTNTGSATVTVMGGTQPYFYAWSDGQTTAMATGLVAGNYFVTATDFNGCSVIAPVNISTAQPISCNTYTVNSTCGDSNGSAQVNVFNAVMPVTYLWSDGQDSSVAINLVAGMYTVTVTDANGCSTECNATVNTQGNLISFDVGFDVSCNGGTDGAASVLLASGGTAPYTYLWSTSSTDSQITGLTSGTYNYTVTDSLGCMIMDSVVVSEPNALLVAASNTSVSCYGYSDGSVASLATGGTAPYIYTWSNGQGLNSQNNLIAGIYTVTAMDINGCTASAQTTVLEGDSISCTFNVVDPAFCEEPTGEVEIFPVGGTAPYTFVWATTPVQTTSTASNLPGGSVFVTITDANGCSKVECIKVPVQNGPQYSVVNSVYANGTNISCNGATDGFINVIVLSGGPATYSWSNGATTSSVSNLPAGTYTVMISAGPCEIFHTTTLLEPNLLSTNTTGIDITCAGTSSGLALVNANGGTQPYNYSWNTSPPQFNSVITGLSAGTYDVTVADANGCTAIDQVIITEPATVFSATETVTQISCNGLLDGAIDVTTLGGLSPYQFNWADGSTDEDRVGLSTGVYKLTVTDDAGCVVVVCAAIAEPILLVAGINSIGVTSPGGTDGSALAVVAGGTPPYAYVWSNSATTQSINNLTAGYYTVTITDANGCIATASAEVFEPSSSLTSGVSGNPVSLIKTKVYPNPTNGLFSLEIESTNSDQVYLDLFDMNGRLVGSEKMQIQKGVTSKEFNLVNAEKGIYFIRIYTEAKFEDVIRVILQ